MRNAILGSLIFAVATAACSGSPQHHIDRVHLSDSPALSNALAHTDGYDGSFELARMQYMHAHLDVTYSPVWWTRQVQLACTLTGPADRQVQTIKRSQELPRGQTSTTWVVIFSGGESVRWAEGQYKIACATPTSSITGQFSVIDTTTLLAQPTGRPTIDELLGKEHKGSPSPLPSATPPAGSPFDTLPKKLNELFAHTHNAESPPMLRAPAAPSPSGAAPPQPAESVPVTIEPRFYTTDTRLGEIGIENNQFDTASVKYIGYEVPLQNAGESFTIRGCVLLRSRTGVVMLGSTGWTLGKDIVTLRGSYGSDTPGQWLPGQYDLHCASEGVNIARKSFTVYGRPQGNPALGHLGLKLPIPDAKATAIKFIESGYNAPALETRRYYTGFSGSPRYIGTEVTLELKVSPQPQPFTYACTYFSDDGGVIGRADANLEIPAGLTSYTMWVSWGNPQGNFWWNGTFYSECDMNGVFLAARYFTVQR